MPWHPDAPWAVHAPPHPGVEAPAVAAAPRGVPNYTATMASPSPLTAPRTPLPAVLLGAGVIVAYAIVGALLMNDWAVVAASGLPLDATIRAMAEAGESYSSVPGLVFAGAGLLLAVLWGVVTARTAVGAPWAATTLGAAILVGGAPAYFYASFYNLNSVGDTFVDWNADAAWAIEAPLYWTSAAALIVGAAALVGSRLRRAAGEGVGMSGTGVTNGS